MSEAEGDLTLHRHYERVMARALRSDDPVASVRAAAKHVDCPDALRPALLAACSQPAGLRMAALLAARLRFERLLQGSARAAAMFDADAERFAATFRAYHAEIPAAASFPGAEGAAFDAWLTQHA